MKDVLEYTKEELESFSNEELEKLAHECEEKSHFFEIQQLVQKIMINSLYGALSLKYFILFNAEIARAITGNGRFLIKNTAKAINKKLNEVNKTESQNFYIYSDTDSVYFSINSIVEKIFEKKPDLTLNEKVDIVDKFEKTVIAPVVDNTIKNVCEKLNAAKPEVIGCKREGIFDAFIAIQKKKYIARERDDEGTRYPEEKPKMKRMGVELTKAQTCPFSKKKLLDSLNIIFDKSEDYLNEWVEEQRALFYKESIDNISNYGSISSLDYDLNGKNVPFMCKGGIIHNKYIKENNLQKYFQPFRNGDKCRIVFLKKPNLFGNNDRLIFNDVKFAEIFKDYIDYETSFDKFFISPLQNMVKALGFDLEKKVATFDEW